MVVSARIAALCLTTALAMLIVAHAPPVSAQGTDARRHGCMADAFRLCADSIPDEGRIEACLKANRRSLNPECRREVFGDVPAGRKRIKRVKRSTP